MLARKGASARRVDAAGRSPLHWAVHHCLARLCAADRAAQEAHARRLGLWRDESSDSEAEVEETKAAAEAEVEVDEEGGGEEGVVATRVDAGTQTDAGPGLASDVELGAGNTVTQGAGAVHDGSTSATTVAAVDAVAVVDDGIVEDGNDRDDLSTEWWACNRGGSCDRRPVRRPACLVPLCRRGIAATHALAPDLAFDSTPDQLQRRSAAARRYLGHVAVPTRVWGAFPSPAPDAPRGRRSSPRDAAAAIAAAKARAAAYARIDIEAANVVYALVYRSGADVQAVDHNGISALDIALGSLLVPLTAAPDGDEYIRPCLPRTAQLIRIVAAAAATVMVARAAPDATPPPRLGYWEVDLHAAVALDDGKGSVVSAALRVDGHGSVHAVDGRGRTPLHWAVASAAPPVTGRAAVVRALLDAGADANAVDAAGWSPLGYALAFPPVRDADNDLFWGLLDSNSDVDDHNDDDGIVRLLLTAAGAAGRVAARGPGGATVLSHAVTSLDLARVRECLSDGATVDAGVGVALARAWATLASSAHLKASLRGWPATAFTAGAAQSTDELARAVGVSQLLLDQGATVGLVDVSPPVPMPVIATALQCAMMSPVASQPRDLPVDTSSDERATVAPALLLLPAVLSIAAAASLDVLAEWSTVLERVAFADCSMLDFLVLIVKRAGGAALPPGVLDAKVRAVDAASPPRADAARARLLRTLKRCLLLPADPNVAVASAVERALVRGSTAGLPGLPDSALHPLLSQVAVCGGPASAAALRFLLARGASPNWHVNVRLAADAGDDDRAFNTPPAGGPATAPLLFVLCVNAPADAVAVVAAAPACNLEDGVGGVPPLLVACGRGDVDVLRALLSAASVASAGGTDAGAPSRPLGIRAAVPDGWIHPCVESWASSLGGDGFGRAPLSGSTALHLLLRSQVKVSAELRAAVAALLAAGAPADTPDDAGWTPLALTATRSSWNASADGRGIVQEQVRAGAAPAACARSLLAAGARVDGYGDDGRTVLSWVVCAAVGAGVAPGSRTESAAAGSSDEDNDGILELLDVVLAAVAVRGRGGRAAAWTLDFGGGVAPPLHVAVGAGHEAAVRRLLRAGADANAVASGDPAIATPLRRALAARPLRVAVVDALLSAGADPNARACDGRTPLEAAVTDGHGSDDDAAAVVALLLRAGARPSVVAPSTGRCVTAAVVCAAAAASGGGGPNGEAGVRRATRLICVLLPFVRDAGVVVAPPWGPPLALFVREHGAAVAAAAAVGAARLARASFMRARGEEVRTEQAYTRHRFGPGIAAVTAEFVVALARGGGGGDDLLAPVTCPTTGAVVPLCRAGLLGADAPLRAAVCAAHAWDARGRGALVALRVVRMRAAAAAGTGPAAAVALGAMAAGDAAPSSSTPSAPAKRSRGELRGAAPDSPPPCKRTCGDGTEHE